MPNLRSAFIKFCGLGLGIGLGLGVCFLFWAWYASSPKLAKQLAKPWDTKSLTVEFEEVKTLEDGKKMVLDYGLANNTDFDYEISNESQVLFTLRRTKERSLAELPLPDVLNPKILEIPFFLPARQKMLFRLQISKSVPLRKPPSQASKEEFDKYDAQLREYLNESFPGLDGFVMFDRAKRYQVIFPPGWKSK